MAKYNLWLNSCYYVFMRVSEDFGSNNDINELCSVLVLNPAEAIRVHSDHQGRFGPLHETAETYCTV